MKTNHQIKLGVSLYSYQDNYYFHKHDLEGCIAAAAGAGAEGIEVFPEAMMPEWPYVSDAFIDQWNGWMERYDVEPVTLDHFSDRRMWKNKNLSDDELFERSIWYIKLARRLGCKAIRVMHDDHIGQNFLRRDYKLTDITIIERLLPVAARYNIMMALECHSPTAVDDPIQQKYIDLAERSGLPFLGLQVDFSSYEYCISTADVGMYTRRGAHPEILNFVRNKQREAYFAGGEFHYAQIEDQVKKLGPNEQDYAALEWVRRHTKVYSLEKLKEYASKVVYMHGKFYDIDSDGQVDNIDYPKVMKALQDGGYKGYICSEFEGNRRMNDAGWVDEIEYVRKHQVLMRKCLGYGDGGV
jgi:sugar phosphate isomerase/epimerase